MNHLVLIGMNYRPIRTSGDKNFWVDLIQEISCNFTRITVISVRQNSQPTESLKINNCLVTINYIRPKFLESPDATYTWKSLFWNGGAFPRGLGVIEKLLNVKSILHMLHNIMIEHPYDHIHLMDNFGFGNPLIATSTRTSVSVSAMAYQGKKHNFLYNMFLKACYSHSNLTVVPYSSCYKEKLVNLGLSAEKLCHIHWGVRPYSQADKTKSLKKHLAILWTGYIQQINREDFFFALRIAKSAVQQGINASFIFAFKPESFEASFQQYNDPENRITIKSTSVQEFSELRKNVSILFSPVVSKSTILAPPLSWLEMLNSGIPIVTTDVPGASEAVIDGVTGCIAKSDQELVSALFKAVDNHKVMGNNCKQLILSKYNIKSCAHQYIELWNMLASQKGN